MINCRIEFDDEKGSLYSGIVKDKIRTIRIVNGVKYIVDAYLTMVDMEFDFNDDDWGHFKENECKTIHTHRITKIYETLLAV